MSASAYDRKPRTFAQTMNPVVMEDEERSGRTPTADTVKITVRLSREVYEAARSMAFDTKRPMSQLQGEGLRLVLERAGYL